MPEMIDFIYHPIFQNETAAFKRRFPKFSDGLESFKKISEVHFHPITPRQVIAPGKLHRIKDCESFTIWKVELAVQNLKSNQFPRVWFAVRGSSLAFLCAKTHIDNYDNNEVDRIAESLAAGIF